MVRKGHRETEKSQRANAEARRGRGRKRHEPGQESGKAGAARRQDKVAEGSRTARQDSAKERRGQGRKREGDGPVVEAKVHRSGA